MLVDEPVIKQQWGAAKPTPTVLWDDILQRMGELQAMLPAGESRAKMAAIVADWKYLKWRWL